MAAIPAFAEKLAELEVGCVAVGGPGAEKGLGTFEVVAKAQVDDARDGIGAVDCRGPIGQNFDTLYGGDRNQRDVGKGAAEATERGAGPVNEDERRGVAEAAQIDPAAVGSIRACAVARRCAKRCFGYAPAESLRERLEHLLDGAVAAFFDFLSADRYHWRTRWTGTAYARPGDDDGVVPARTGQGTVSRARVRRIAVSRAQYESAVDELWRKARSCQQPREGTVRRHSSAHQRRAPSLDQLGREDDLPSRNVRIFSKCVPERLCRNVIFALLGLRMRGDRTKRTERASRGQKSGQQILVHPILPAACMAV